MSKQYLPAGEIATFCSQIVLILKSGIPMHDGMQTLCESCEEEKAKKAFEQIANIVQETGSLYEAVKQVGFFPDYMINMIHIGEETGKLESVLDSLSRYYERDAKIKKSIKTAITYPILLLIMMAAVILLLVTQVMPIFDDIFANLGTDMSDSGKTIMNLGMTIGTVAFIAVFAVICIGLILYIASKCGAKDSIMNIMCKLPAIRKLNNKIASGRFSSVLAMMLSSGYSLEKALQLAPDIVTDKNAKNKINKCAQLVAEGKSFSEALFEMNMYTGLQARMISVAVKAGQLDTVMEKMTEVYDEEVDDSITKLVSYIEPSMVAILSIIIGGILLSVMLPLAGIMSSIG